jgi:hypothetical protein
MGVLDQLLGWAVIAFPFLLSILFVFIPARTEDEKKHMKWRNVLVAVGAIFSLVAWWQQSRSLQAAKKDRDDAIKQTSDQVTKSVTEAVGSQYKDLIGSLTNQIGDLKGQLAEQGKKVDVIQKSNIVTGKKPVKVEVINPGSPPSGETLPNLSWTQEERAPENGHAITTVGFKIDGVLNLPGFIAVCDHPCKAVGGTVLYGASQGTLLSVGSNVTGFLFNIPRPLTSGVQCRMTLESSDDKPIKVTSFRILHESEIPMALK